MMRNLIFVIFAICNIIAVVNCLVKPGSCPKPGIGICVEKCSGDDSCPGDQKCCSNGCGHVCMSPVNVVITKPGFCPKPIGFGICVEQCFGDSSCPDDQKCCSNGCGHVCTQPVDEKPGLCPKLRKSKSCIRGCPGDGSCPGDLKCCKRCCKSGGCGGVCVNPIPCTLDPNWKGDVRHKKKECLNCSCSDILAKSKKLMKKACKKKPIRKACCLICASLKK